MALNGMIPVLSVAQMRAIDDAAIAGSADVGFRYMIRAGAGLADKARAMHPDPASGGIAIVCGKGNNGGDGFVAGKLLVDAGYRVTCFLLSLPEDLAGEARIAFDRYAAGTGELRICPDAGALSPFTGHALIIDAILGSGMQGNPRGVAADAIRAINAKTIPVLAADTPSGLDNNTGVPGDPCIKATATVAMGFPKIGSFVYPGRSNVGKLDICDLGYPDELVRRTGQVAALPSPAALRRMLPPRKPGGSKTDHGVCLMVCGSHGMSGAAELASKAAMRTGCGMVHLISPRSMLDTLALKVTEVVLRPAAETAEGTLSLEAFDQIMEASRRMNCLCIGPGLSCNTQTMELVRRVVAQVEIPVVLDADGINAFRDHAAELKNRPAPLIMTPHAGEWARLFGTLPAGMIEGFARMGSVAAEYDMTVLHKGSPSRSAAPDGTCALLPFGNSGMATAGCGDVLAGIISSLVAQGCPVADAAILGAFIHGTAGDFTRDELGEYSMIAGDIIVHIHQAIQLLTQ